MTLQLRKWVSRLLNLSAGVVLCTSIGCKSPGADHAPSGPGLPPVTKTMGPGNQVSSPGQSPAFANIQGQGPALNNGLPPMQANNQQSVNYGGNPNPQMQGMQIPPMNQGNPAYGQQNQQVMPSQFGQQPVQQFSQRQPISQQPPVQPLPLNQSPAYQQTPQLQSPQLQQQGPAISIPPGRLPTSMEENLRIPDSMPNVRQIAEPSGAGLMRVNHESPAPMMLEPKPAAQRELPPVQVLGELKPRTGAQPANVVTTPTDNQPPLEAPIVIPPPR